MNRAWRAPILLLLATASCAGGGQPRHDWQRSADGSFTREEFVRTARLPNVERCWPAAGGFDCLRIEREHAPALLVSRQFRRQLGAPAEALSYACRFDPDRQTWYEQLILRKGNLNAPISRRRVARETDGSGWSKQEAEALAAKYQENIAHQFVNCESMYALIMQSGVPGLLDAAVTPEAVSG